MSLILNTRAAKGLELSVKNRRRTKPLRCKLGFHQFVIFDDGTPDKVPQSYPPETVDYVSPKRICGCCERIEWLVGPEVCGGKKPRWVAALAPHYLDDLARNCVRSVRKTK